MTTRTRSPARQAVTATEAERFAEHAASHITDAPTGAAPHEPREQEEALTFALIDLIERHPGMTAPVIAGLIEGTLDRMAPLHQGLLLLPLLAIQSEVVATLFLESVAGDRPCPACGRWEGLERHLVSGETHVLRAAIGPAWTWRCHGCQHRYSVRDHTLLERHASGESPVALRDWVYLLWMAAVSPEGAQVQRLQKTGRVGRETARWMGRALAHGLHRADPVLGRFAPLDLRIASA